jgi:peroxiredoxin
MRKYFISIFCILTLLNSCNNSSCLKQGSKIGNDMLLTIEHQRYYMNQHKGKVSVLIFWATWCTVCKKEMIAFESYKSGLNNEKLNVVAVCINPDEIDKVKNIITQLNIHYPILLDEEAKMYERLQTGVVPITLIVDAKGQIDETVEGFNEQILRKMTSRIDLLLENHE